jgi:hypothetical protein
VTHPARSYGRRGSIKEVPVAKHRSKSSSGKGKTKRKSKGKKRRTPAQKAAFKRMIAALCRSKGVGVRRKK